MPVAQLAPVGPAGMAGGPAGGAGGGGLPLAAGTGVAGEGRKAAVAATRRKTAAGQDQRHEMRERMRYIMYEIDETNDRFISSRADAFQFLDVCCCPGGFSTYSLTAGPAPRKGIGLSLPPELGGHLPAIQQETDNYFLQFVDVTTVAAGVRVADMGVGVPGCPRASLRMDAALDEPPSSRCQLVILDGSFLGGKDWIHKETSLPDSENPAFNVYGSNAAAHKALLVAQLIVMANNLAAGGLLVLRLNMFPDNFTVGVLGLLRQVFNGQVASYKPRSCHVHVGSYYLVCSGFDPQRAFNLQWVPRWQSCLAAMRARGPPPRFVPFPGLSLDSPAAITLWTRPMYTYHVHLWRFLKLVEVAMEEKAMLDRRQPGRPRRGRFTNSCGRIFAGVPCRGACNAAHAFDELHPFVQKAFREPRGFLFQPGSMALMAAPLVAYDPLPETLLELRQQAHMQAIVQAQAAAASQRAALEAAVAAATAAAPGGAAGPGGLGPGGTGGGAAGANVLGHVGSYNNAVEYGMAGEWVHGLMRDPRDTDEAGEDALRLFMREADDGNVVLEGGFDEDPPPYHVPHPGPPPLPAEAAEAAEAADAALPSHGSPQASTTADDHAVAAGGVKAGGGAGAGGAATPAAATAATSIRPELLRMSAYQPRLGLVTVEVEDDATLKSMLVYLGC
ncbi:hypothetical protein GPECTOR_6g497 [Gonium pectorale]|uniref:Cap-specific mRNA (nucleoside-2'-O-)-methyltransferase 1 n=1 Tax=Gonium pectorale TaxID=33097 RepID=A0A150GW39_GONPE|nr:hypothetical protein GPECTOR_6g497 [Gonium pectorale]|eukprot:KXZ53580.1 hypothetical protein GPECTOR_6g497 [Gonium pectorale]